MVEILKPLMGRRKDLVREHKRKLDEIIKEWRDTIGLPEPYYIHISDLSMEIHISKRSRWLYDTSKSEFILEVEKKRLFEDLMTNHLRGWRSKAKKLKEGWLKYKSLAEDYISSCRSLYKRIEKEVEDNMGHLRKEETPPAITENFVRFIYQNAFYRVMGIYGFEEMKYQIRDKRGRSELWFGNTTLATGEAEDMAMLKNIHRGLMNSFETHRDEVNEIVRRKQVLDVLRDELVSYMEEFLRKKRLKGRCKYIE
ncbi:MAG: hypothetical protein SBU_000192 [Candidatus Syntrophoarchaeum butanivorans]|uniref:Uncharacterized protein n=3 Tax=Candidatus Syntropharchaeum butanivorans TaxID=1839936 RepID=A0A1F2P6D8_9EURY|nr:MAG: hypothetical protein SBU_000192 [Candidatus Syntrophoarchaeum butanivorans]